MNVVLEIVYGAAGGLVSTVAVLAVLVSLVRRKMRGFNLPAPIRRQVEDEVAKQL